MALRSRTLSVILFASLGALPACRRQQEPPPPPVVAAPVPPEAPVTAASESERSTAETRTLDFEKGERAHDLAVADQRRDLRRAGLPAENDAEELTPEQRQLLETRISRERGSRKNLLQEILDQDVKIRSQRSELEALAGQVPANRIAQAGDRHDRIAMDFLLQRGVPAEKAYQLISTLTLDDALVPGFRVWTYYNNGQFGTWVTQGTAAISPAERQKRLREEVLNLRAESAALMERADGLGKSNDELRKRAEAGEADAAAAIAAAEKAEAEAKARGEALMNVVHYVIGTKKALESARLIDGRLRLMSLDLPEPRALNLATAQTITFEPGSYDARLKKVKRIRLAPATLVEGTDYSVEAVADVGVQLRVLNPAKFLAAGKFLVVIE